MTIDNKSNKKILFIANHRLNRSPGQRFRFEQYIQYLSTNGFNCKLSYIISASDDKVLYSKGKYFRKGIILLKSYWKRWNEILELDNYDLIFVYREALLNGSNFFEKRYSKSRAKLIFDFDDAIWNLDTSDGNKNLEWLKNENKTLDNIKLADLVITGNKYLAEFSQQYSKNVIIIPTTIDTTYHKPAKGTKKNKTLCIGWTGSLTTIKHFEIIIPTLEKLKVKYGSQIFFKVIGDENFENSELGIKGHPWKLENEIDDLQEIDIGIMPLPNDEWSKGKCGFKGLQYMALEIPTVMSPVGVNTEIISHANNGFLAANEQEWIDTLSLLIDSPQLRKKIGIAARKTVIEKYSVISQQQNYLDTFSSLLEGD